MEKESCRIIHSDWCFVDLVGKRQIVLTADGIWEVPFLSKFVPTEPPTFTRTQIQSVTLELTWFHICALAGDGKRVTRTYYPTFSYSKWIDAFQSAGFHCVNAAVFDRNELGGKLCRNAAAVYFLPLFLLIATMIFTCAASLLVPSIQRHLGGIAITALVTGIGWFTFSQASMLTFFGSRCARMKHNQKANHLRSPADGQL
jgi:hypothetical protein